MTVSVFEADLSDKPPVERQAYRNAMSRVASSVHVVTTDGSAGRAGLTMTAVASVTDRPPTLLICVGHTASANALIKANGVFCVSTLSAGSEALADAFAGRGGLTQSDRFALGTWQCLTTSAPALIGARVAFDCRVTSIIEVETHSVFFAEVLAVALGAADQALVYLDRQYMSVGST
jgi:flavin reductase (DIM6/NTAB) family NADH-FMN oxidoreductase RutF